MAKKRKPAPKRHPVVRRIETLLEQMGKLREHHDREIRRALARKNRRMRPWQARLTKAYLAREVLVADLVTKGWTFRRIGTLIGATPGRVAYIYGRTPQAEHARINRENALAQTRHEESKSAMGPRHVCLACGEDHYPKLQDFHDPHRCDRCIRQERPPHGTVSDGEKAQAGR